jgi:hypothetical protein
MPSIYVPQSAAIGCDVALFEAYFGYKAKGTEVPGAGTFPLATAAHLRPKQLDFCAPIVLRRQCSCALVLTFVCV